MRQSFILIVLLANLFIQCQARQSEFVPVADTTYLRPSPQLTQEALVISRALNAYHYQKVNINDELSAKILENYLDALDPYKSYFLATDIQKFNTEYGDRLDNDFQEGNLDAAFDIYNVFRKRYQDRQNTIDSLVNLEYDFTIDETYETDRKDSDYAKNDAELTELWRKIIKSQALNYKLANKEWDEIHKNLGKRYAQFNKNIGQQKVSDVFQTYMNAITEAYDPHTSYFSPATAENFQIDMSRSLEGIGASLQSDGDYTKVAEVIAGGPAFKSKLIFKDDRIIGVGQDEDGEMVDVIGWRLDEVVKLIRGPKGSTVRLSLLRASDGANALPVEISLVREKVNLEDQRAQSIVVPYSYKNKEYKIGVINIPSFYMDFEGAQKGDPNYSSTTRDVRKLISDLKKQGIDGLVIDLTYNGGGSLTEAVELTGLFIPDGPVVQVKSTDGSIEALKDPDPAQVYDGPLAVTINRFSASASEIFAGAIQDYHRGIIIGEQTFGKGTVQNLIGLNRLVARAGNNGTPNNMGELGELKITLAKFYRVTGSSTQHRGVSPDVALPSEFGASEFGESSYPTALPWDQIAKSDFKQSKSLSDKSLKRIQESYQNRLNSDQELKMLAQNIAKSKEIRERSEISLNLETRKKEMDELKNKEGNEGELTKKIKSFELPDEEANQALEKYDPYVKESIRILAELIAA
jgi:carboxyl-terminal processing protease